MVSYRYLRGLASEDIKKYHYSKQVTMSEQRLYEIEKLGVELEPIEVEQTECECCGLKEECTEDYISKVKGFNSGKWVCGLCCDAVRETLEKGPKEMGIEEAINSHKDFCQNFNNSRLNPKLSLAFAIRDIAKRSFQRRNSKNSPLLKLGRTTSCVPRIDLK